MKDKTLHVIQNLYRHIVPTQLLMKIREIAQGDVSIYACMCFISVVLYVFIITYATLIACIQYSGKYFLR